MKRNPLIPFATTAVVGIFLIVILSFYGDYHREQAAQQEQGAGAEMSAKELYLQNCVSCHGENLEGGAGPALKKVGARMSKEEILQQILEGGGGMPAGILTGKKAEAVAEWLSKMK